MGVDGGEKCSWSRIHPAAPSPVPLPCFIHHFCTRDVQQIGICAAQSPLSSPAWSCLLPCVLCLFVIFIHVFDAYKKDFSASLGGVGNAHFTVNHCWGSFSLLLQSPGGARGAGWDSGAALQGPCGRLSLSGLVCHWEMQEITITSRRLHSLDIKWCEKLLFQECPLWDHALGPAPLTENLLGFYCPGISLP